MTSTWSFIGSYHSPGFGRLFSASRIWPFLASNRRWRTLFLLDQNNLGRFNSTNKDIQEVTPIPPPIPPITTADYLELPASTSPMETYTPQVWSYPLSQFQDFQWRNVFSAIR